LKLSLLGRILFEISKFHVSIQFLGVYGIYTVEPILYKNGTSGTTPNSLRNGTFLRWTDARLIAGTRKSTPVINAQQPNHLMPRAEQRLCRDRLRTEIPLNYWMDLVCMFPRRISARKGSVRSNHKMSHELFTDASRLKGRPPNRLHHNCFFSFPFQSYSAHNIHIGVPRGSCRILRLPVPGCSTPAPSMN
jgi:hypothetical protein